MSDLYYNLYRFNLNQKTSSVRFISISRGAFVIFVYLPLTFFLSVLQQPWQQSQFGEPNMAHDKAKLESWQELKHSQQHWQQAAQISILYIDTVPLYSS